MGPNFLLPIVCIFFASAAARQTALPNPEQGANLGAPLPDIRSLLLDVERNQMAAEAAHRDYTYHVHLERQELDRNGHLKKITVTDSESLTIDGVRVDRVVARNGKPLTPDEAKKEDERLDQEVSKGKERREKLQDQGHETDSRGDTIITASRILELGSFSNPRRINWNGRPTIVADYVGDPNARTRSSAEGMIRDLVGTVWIDEKDRTLARGEGHFLNDFKVGGGLLLEIHKGLSFSFQTTKVNDEVWLPASIDAEGSARILLFGSVSGRLHLATSNYRKFRTTSSIVSGNTVVAPDGTPIPPPISSAAAHQHEP